MALRISQLTRFGILWATMGLLALFAAAGFAEEPITAVGHGEVLDASGNAIELSEKFIRDAQEYYFASLQKGASKSQLEDAQPTLDALQTALDKEGLNPTLARSYLNAWMIANLQPAGAAHLKMKNVALRMGLEKLLGGAPPLSAELEEILYATGARDDAWSPEDAQAYIAECEAAGVPIPPDWGDQGPGRWDNGAELTDEFLSESLTTEVYSYTSTTSPRGQCIALPRKTGSNISLLGIICLGQESSKACFWDNRNVPVGAVVPIEDFRGGPGLALSDWGQGICSDCHAGENPFVIHPATPLEAATLMPTRWHEPLVDPSWPQNPGPSNLLDAIPLNENESSCLDCHNGPSGYAGRFPEISTELAGYCVDVLKKATRRTMPYRNCVTLNRVGQCKDNNGRIIDPPLNHIKHAVILEAACQQPPTPVSGTEVDPSKFSNDANFSSPPILSSPLYACAKHVLVRGAVRHAEIRVYIDGTLVADQEALDPEGEGLSVPALIAGQVVYATQVVDGVESDPSNSVTVRDHRQDYPAGLPEPRVEPQLIYECGHTIAVKAIPGATVNVWVNDADQRVYSGPADWYGFYPGKTPFDPNDRFNASQSLCGDTSAPSAYEFAVAPPAQLSTPAFHHELFEGQEMVALSNLDHGSMTRLGLAASSPFVNFSSPWSASGWIDIETSLGRPLQNGDALEANQELCPGMLSTTVTTAVVQPCQENPLPAPRIRKPGDGDERIIVLEAIPGARIQVYTDAGEEIADGSGSVIATRRPIQATEILIAVQTVGKCRSATGYQVVALMFAPEPRFLLQLVAGLSALAALERRRQRRRS